jgi:hypothetical protein
LWLQAVWDPLLTRWYGWEWDGFGLACVELYDLWNPFVDRTLRLIQHNWVVLAYNSEGKDGLEFFDEEF